MYNPEISSTAQKILDKTAIPPAHLIIKDFPKTYNFQYGLYVAFYFPSKNFFRKENIQFSSRAFFSFFVMKLPLTRRVNKSAESLVSCIIHVSGVIAVGNPQVGGSNLAIDHVFYVFLDTCQHVPNFKQQ